MCIRDRYVITPGETATIYAVVNPDNTEFYRNEYGFSTLDTKIDNNADDIEELQFPSVTTIIANNQNIGLEENDNYIYIDSTSVNDIQIDNFDSSQRGWHCWLINNTGELVRVTTDGTESINGSDRLLLAAGDSTEIIYDGFNFYSTTKNLVLASSSGSTRNLGAGHGFSRQTTTNGSISKQVRLPDPDDIFDGWSVIVQNAGDNWQYVRRHADDTSSSIQRDNTTKEETTNALMRESETSEFIYSGSTDTFYRHILNSGILPLFHARVTDTNVNLPLTGNLSGTFVDLDSDDILHDEGGFSLDSNDFALLRTNSNSSETRLFRVTVNAQFSKLSNFSQSGDVVVSGQLRRNSDFLSETQTHSLWQSDDDALIGINISTLIELEDEDRLRVSFSSNPGVNNARFDVFDWTIVEVT